MGSILIGLLTALGTGYVVVFLGLVALQRTMIYKPDRRPPPPAHTVSALFEDVTLRTADGLDLAAWYAPPRAGRPTVIYFHGNAGNRGWMAHKARPYLAAGYGVLVPDYRGYGGNPGHPTEQGLYADARAALDFLSAQGQDPAAEVIYHGESLGSGVASWLAAEVPPRALVLEAAFTSITDLAARQYPWLPVRLGLRDHFATIDRIAGIHVPTLFLHGVHDALVPVAHAQRLFDASGAQAKTLHIIPDGLHADLYDRGADLVVIGWLNGLGRPHPDGNQQTF